MGRRVGCREGGREGGSERGREGWGREGRRDRIYNYFHYQCIIFVYPCLMNKYIHTYIHTSHFRSYLRWYDNSLAVQ